MAQPVLFPDGKFYNVEGVEPEVIKRLYEKLAKEQERVLQVARQGRSFLIQSSPQGVTEEANVAKSFLGSGNRYS